MTREHRSNARHLLMRLALGFVLIWFGMQELHSPGDWAVFVPSVVANHFPGAVDNLVILHGFLLLVAGATVAAGLFFPLGSVLAAGMLGEVVVGLWMDGGLSDLVIRDIGLLGLAAALALDPVRVWQLEDVLVARLRPLREPRNQKQGRRPAIEPRRTEWPVRAGSGAAFLGGLVVLALLLRLTGSSGAPPAVPAEASVPQAQPSPSTAAQPSPSAAAQPSPSSGQPAAADATPSGAAQPSIRFDEWQYRQYAYQIYPGPISSDAQKALAGFALSVQEQGTTVVLNFKALTSQYRDATVSLVKGNTAYFIETNMRDDPNDQENNLNDDGVVAVDPQGYLVPS